MPRLFLPGTTTKGETVNITGDEARYLINVLRMGPGDELELLSPGGNRGMARIEAVTKAGVRAIITDVLPALPEPAHQVVLMAGLIKARMDFVVQKATELGVSDVVPVITQRAQLRYSRKVTRWQKIAREAARQSGRPSPPNVHEPVALKDALTGGPHEGIIFYESAGKSGLTVRPVKDQGRFVVLVGPEGGFTPEEVTFAQDKGLKVASLGPRILRAETAVIAALTLVQYHLGQM